MAFFSQMIQRILENHLYGFDTNVKIQRNEHRSGKNTYLLMIPQKIYAIQCQAQEQIT